MVIDRTQFHNNHWENILFFEKLFVAIVAKSFQPIVPAPKYFVKRDEIALCN